MFSHLFDWKEMIRISLKASEPAYIYRKPLWTNMLLKIFAAFFAFAVALLLGISMEIRGYAFGLFRDIYRAQVLLSTGDMPALSSERFVVKYSPQNYESAQLILDTAEKAYLPVTTNFGFTPSAPVLIVVYSSRQELNKCFGWPASNSAMGAYYAGVIRVLSPEAWVEAGDKEHVRKVFVTSGPMSHELSHLVIDYMTRGNVPRWFTEGLAQYEEYRLSGFRSEELTSSPVQKTYSFKIMDREFDDLPDQVLAYRQSFLAIQYITNEYGEDSIKKILKSLSNGNNINEALYKTLGKDMEKFQADWLQWIKEKKYI